MTRYAEEEGVLGRGDGDGFGLLTSDGAPRAAGTIGVGSPGRMGGVWRASTPSSAGYVLPFSLLRDSPERENQGE